MPILHDLQLPKQNGAESVPAKARVNKIYVVYERERILELQFPIPMNSERIDSMAMHNKSELT